MDGASALFLCVFYESLHRGRHAFSRDNLDDEPLPSTLSRYNALSPKR